MADFKDAVEFEEKTGLKAKVVELFGDVVRGAATGMGLQLGGDLYAKLKEKILKR
jgi:hypothetical protein